ncbi:MAG: LPS assembly lipoprotein LptE [Bacteroidales bacterium]|nr:LPS assembly lipoprotein LptE [Bacteroidales bacterium]
MNKIILKMAAVMALGGCLMLGGCLLFKTQYGFTTNALTADVKTFSVEYFPNRARLVNPMLSQQFTEALQDKLSKQTSLKMETSGGDVEFSGQITGYDTKPMAIKEGDQSAQTRLTVTVSVKYVNNKDHEADWEKQFSAYADFDSSRILSDVENELMEDILDQLMEDIFNASVAAW